MLPHVPTSVVVARLLDDMPAERVDLAWLVGRLEKRSFGLLTLLLALLGLAPGIAMLAMLLLPFPAVQMMMGREHPTLPRFLAARTIPAATLSRWIGKVIPPLRRIEMFIRPRWYTPFLATKRFVGGVILLLAVTLVAPFPFNIIPALAIMLISLAFLEEDGALLGMSLIFAALSVAITVGEVVVTLRTTDFFGRLFAGP